MVNAMKIIISGAGIGGLTAALCAQQAGHEIVLLEQAAALEEVGAGIQIPPNAMKVFRKLGLDGKLDAHGFRPQALEARMGHSGRQLFALPLNRDTQQRWGAPYLHIHRADMMSVLHHAVTAAPTIGLEMNSAVTSYHQDEKSIYVSLADGRGFEGDLLIGADGIHSPVRQQMIGRDAPRFTGNMAWRAVVPVEKLGALAPRPTACIWMGAGKHGVTYLLRQGQLANFVGVVERADWQDESWRMRGSKQEALADFDGWHPSIVALLSAAKVLYRWALFDRAPLPHWVDGRAVLLGDAAHPMLPFMAQGAAMAVEDAYLLAAMLARHDTPHAALAQYQRHRLPRTSALQAASRANAKIFHRRGRLSQIATYGPMWLAGKFAPDAILRRQDAIYGHDVTAL